MLQVWHKEILWMGRTCLTLLLLLLLMVCVLLTLVVLPCPRTWLLQMGLWAYFLSRFSRP
jgi:hypothetical protein